jgi:F0F1-type ATP synthase assembly protein I
VAQKKRRFSLARTAQSTQENVSRAGPVAAASYTLVGGIIVLGGIGYAIDRWRGTAPWFLLAGLLLGVVVGFYELIKTVYQK